MGKVLLPRGGVQKTAFSSSDEGRLCLSAAVVHSISWAGEISNAFVESVKAKARSCSHVLAQCQLLQGMRGGFVVVVAPRRPQLEAVARAAEEAATFWIGLCPDHWL